ncbi:MAG TPA: hypothetical protein VLJ17_14305, partial [Xanthobacteraceae bacterium]|nr:hypothetical protein [Xanthobacteraceae bacterium]
LYPLADRRVSRFDSANDTHFQMVSEGAWPKRPIAQPAMDIGAENILLEFDRSAKYIAFSLTGLSAILSLNHKIAMIVGGALLLGPFPWLMRAIP